MRQKMESEILENNERKEGAMMEGIKLVRIDFRLIHGQVITKWSNKISATRIVVSMMHCQKTNLWLTFM